MFYGRYQNIDIVGVTSKHQITKLFVFLNDIWRKYTHFSCSDRLTWTMKTRFFRLVVTSTINQVKITEKWYGTSRHICHPAHRQVTVCPLLHWCATSSWSWLALMIRYNTTQHDTTRWMKFEIEKWYVSWKWNWKWSGFDLIWLGVSEWVIGYDGGKYCYLFLFLFLFNDVECLVFFLGL